MSKRRNTRNGMDLVNDAMRYANGYKKARTRQAKLKNLIGLIVIAAIVLGVIIGWVLPKVSTTVGTATGQYTATGTAAETLERLTVDDSGKKSGYNRDDFGFRTTDTDGNGCDMRDDILARDLTDVTFKSSDGCTVLRGILDDPYTGQTIHFQRGQDTSAAVQIDHVVALENAWQSGAYNWDRDQLVTYANDPYNLLAVDGPANQGKGSSSAAYWLPTNGAYRCDYVARQIGVKDKYGLTVTSSEKQAMLAVLHGCPGQAIPEDN